MIATGFGQRKLLQIFACLDLWNRITTFATCKHDIVVVHIISYCLIWWICPRFCRKLQTLAQSGNVSPTPVLLPVLSPHYKCALFTKHEADYWLLSFFVFLWTKTKLSPKGRQVCFCKLSVFIQAFYVAIYHSILAFIQCKFHTVQ